MAIGPVRATGSGGEVELAVVLRALREAGIEEPVRQFTIQLPDHSSATVDYAWPLRKVLVEFDGGESRAGTRRVDYDTDRQNQVLELGWDLRRFGSIALRQRPERVVATLLRVLCGYTRVIAV
jgi:very-short-patch-repair endonuclease